MAAGARDNAISNDSDSQAAARKKLSFINEHFSSENRFVVPPLGRKRWISRNESAPNACGLKAGLRTALFTVSARRLFQGKRDRDFLFPDGLFQPLFHLRFHNLGPVRLSLFDDF